MMYNFYQGYYPSNKCQAYKCDQYCDLLSDRWCFEHCIEMSKISDCRNDLISRINSVPSKSTDISCRALNCKEINNLVEDTIIINNKIVYAKFCIIHHRELLKRREYDLLSEKTKQQTCDYNNCRKIFDLDKYQNKLFCPLHYKKVTKIKSKIKCEPKETCHIGGCRKTARLIKSYDKLWCKKHFNEQPNPEIFKSTEPVKYKWVENKVEIKNNDVKNDIVNINQIENKVKDDKKSHTKWIDIVKKVSKISNTDNKKLNDNIPNINDLLNKCINTNKLKICNTEICHANECKIYKQLYEKHQGVWCEKHYFEIIKLRNIINKHDGSKEELNARIKELELRKFPDLNHWKWAIKLLKHYQKHS